MFWGHTGLKVWNILKYCRYSSLLKHANKKQLLIIAHSFAKFSIVFKNVIGCLQVAVGQGKFSHYYFDIIPFGTSCMRDDQNMVRAMGTDSAAQCLAS